MSTTPKKYEAEADILVNPISSNDDTFVGLGLLHESAVSRSALTAARFIRNPQVAARLATGLRSWRSLEPVRQEKAREALLKLAGAENLSADLRDIVERTLA